jgi:hypothetical protein
MFDIKKQPYFCEYYKQRVFVHIKRDLCDKGEYCPEPQPHVMGKQFIGCSDILNCGAGSLVDGRVIWSNIRVCPAHTKLNITAEEL